MKFITLTFNPAIDITYHTSSSFQSGELSRAESTLITPGGKGINVARALTREFAHYDTLAMFFANRGKPFGDMLCGMLDKEDIKYTALPYSDPYADTRVCVKVRDKEGVTTEINGKGAFVGEEEVKALVDMLIDIISSGEKIVLLLCGSIPQPVEIHVYYPVIKLMKSCGAICILDSSGYSLKEGIDSFPQLIKPSLRELSELAGRPLDFDTNAVEYCLELFHRTGSEILLTNGGKGAYFVGNEGVFKSVPQECIGKGECVGCGDAFLASFAISYYKYGKGAKISLDDATKSGEKRAKEYFNIKGNIS